MRVFDAATGKFKDPVTGNLYNSLYDNDNSGQVTVGTTGDLNIGLGNGLTYDVNTGGLGMNVGGVTIDF